MLSVAANAAESASERREVLLYLQLDCYRSLDDCHSVVNFTSNTTKGYQSLTRSVGLERTVAVTATYRFQSLYPSAPINTQPLHHHQQVVWSRCRSTRCASTLCLVDVTTVSYSVKLTVVSSSRPSGFVWDKFPSTVDSSVNFTE